MTSPRLLVTSPESPTASPAMIFINVDLPQPFRPTRPMRSPCWMASVAPSKTV